MDRGMVPDPADLAARPPVGLYLHIPFCVSLCPYCDFVVLSGRAARGPGNRIADVVAALHVELALRARVLDAAFRARPPLRSVYLGGGTPSLLTAAQVGGLLDDVARQMGIAADAEVTLEANPGAAELGDLAGFRRAGVSRLSLGAQSLDPQELRRIGRRHHPDDVIRAVGAARDAGFASVNLDLLLDIPGQSVDSLGRTLDRVASMAPEHVSGYLLTLEDPDADGLTGVRGDHLPVRPGARRWRERARAQQDEDRLAELDALMSGRLSAAGLERYELSNHAQPGHESRHNLAYWRREPVEALGPGAHAFDGGGMRRWNAARVDRYLAALLPAEGAPLLPPGGSEQIDEQTAWSEATILALRLRDGVTASLLDDADLGRGLRWGVREALLRVSTDRLVLTDRGRLLSNEVFARLLPDRAT